jgi:hypothetical protein
VVGPAHFKTVVPLMRVIGTRIRKEGPAFFLSMEWSTPHPPKPVTSFLCFSSFFAFFMADRSVLYVRRGLSFFEAISNGICDIILFFNFAHS